MVKPKCIDCKFSDDCNDPIKMSEFRRKRKEILNRIYKLGEIEKERRHNEDQENDSADRIGKI